MSKSKKSVIDITNDNCSTKTYVVKCKDEHKYTQNELLKILPGSVSTKFRNCVIKKMDKICVKLYSNLTLQITGLHDEHGILKILEMVDIKSAFESECVMSNWSVKLSSTPIDLNTTMSVLNDNGITAYFLRGYPLIIKYSVDEVCTKKEILYTNNTFIFRHEIRYDKVVEVSVLLFKTGNCIVSGKTQKSCSDCISVLKSKIQLVEQKANN